MRKLGSIFFLLVFCQLLQAQESIEDSVNRNEFALWLVLLNVSALIAFFYLTLMWRANRNKKNEIKLREEINNAKLQSKNDQHFIENQTKQLKELDKAKTRFFTNVSHELRTPLTLIIGPLATIKKSGELSEKNLNLLNHAETNAESLLKLVRSILDLSQLEAGSLKIVEKPTMIYPMIKRIASTYQAKAQNSDKKIILNYFASEKLCLDIDKGKLEIILNNLMSNALKFTERDASIEIKLTDRASNIEIEVIDDGIGINEDDLPKVFDRFFESSDSENNQGGSKIGLALCRELCKVMGGNIAVNSEWGQGSTFRVKLPKKEVITGHSEHLHAKTEASILVETNQSKEKDIVVFDEDKSTVLIVEDNHSLRDYLQTILSDKYNILEAENGKVALDFLEAQAHNLQVDIVISDIMMPVMDGYALLTALKSNEKFRSIPVIMLTARAEVQDKLKALRIGVDDYLFKPYNEAELFVRIKNLLENYQSRKEAVIDDKKMVFGNAVEISIEDQAWLEGCEAFILENLANEHMSVPHLAREFNMSESTLNRQLKKLIGMTTGKYLQEIRLNYAKNLLERKEYSSIAKVAYQVGFTDAKSFSRAFKQRFGKIPSELMEI